MVEPTKRLVDQSVEESMKLFQRAKVGRVAPVAPRRPERVLLVLDGSSQDQLAVAMARDIHKRLGASLAVLDAREGGKTDDLARRTAETLGAESLAERHGSSYDQILEGAESARADLVVVPCPYQRDLESVGPDSAGTVIDVLLARLPAPFLVVRKPYDPKDDCLAALRLVLTSDNRAASAAASWTVGLVAPGGRIRLVLILEAEFYENLRTVLESIAPDLEVGLDDLSDALARTHMRLHRGLQKAAMEHDFHYQLDFYRCGQSGCVLPPDESARAVIVLALERPDHASQGFVQEQIRLSPHPVLIVPAG